MGALKIVVLVFLAAGPVAVCEGETQGYSEDEFCCKGKTSTDIPTDVNGEQDRETGDGEGESCCNGKTSTDIPTGINEEQDQGTVDENEQPLLGYGLQYTKLFEEGDFEGLAKTLYTPYCILMPPDGPALYGSELVKYFASFDVRRFVGEAGEVIVDGNIAASRDKFKGYNKDGTLAMSGNTLTIWKNLDGQWYIKFNMWTKAV